MAIKLSQLKNKTKRVKFEFEGEKVTVDYRTGSLTPETQVVAMQMLGLDDDPSPQVLNDFVGVMVDIVSGWDVLGEDGQPEPVTPALMRKLPMSFLGSIFRAVMEDMRPNAESAES